MSVFTELNRELDKIVTLCHKVKSGENIILLGANEKHVLFEVQALAEDLSERASELDKILYEHKILI